MKDATPILVVDDDAMVLRVVVAALERVYGDVAQASSAEEALEQLERKRFALVLTDWKMPGIDGLELARRVQQDHTDTRVMVMSGNVTDNDERVVEQSGARLLRKPFDAQILIASVLEALR